MEQLCIFPGMLLIAVVLHDVFQTVIVPRKADTIFRITPVLIVFFLWPLFKLLSTKGEDNQQSESVLNIFAPLAVIVLLLAWVSLLIVGYGAILYGLRAGIRPQIDSFGTALYFAGTCLFTLGFGEFVASSVVARLAALCAALTGLVILALVTSLLFSLHSSFQRREALVLLLIGRAGAPPSGVTFLENYALLGLRNRLPDDLTVWEIWAAEVLETQSAYALLPFFRSFNRETSWIAALGAVLDAASILISTVDDIPDGTSQLFHAVGTNLAEEMCSIFRLESNAQVGVSFEEFVEARKRLEGAGFKIAEQSMSWYSFQQLRSQYAGRLKILAEFFRVIPPVFIFTEKTAMAASDTK
jgi:hypothetical protein